MAGPPPAPADKRWGRDSRGNRGPSERSSSFAVGAGDRIRTADVQLGNVGPEPRWPLLRPFREAAQRVDRAFDRPDQHDVPTRAEPTDGT